MGIQGSWDVTFTVMTGASSQETWTIEEVDGEVRLHGVSAEGEISDAVLNVDGDAFAFELPLPNMPLKAAIAGQADGDRMSGAAKLAAMQFGTFEGTRIG